MADNAEDLDELDLKGIPLELVDNMLDASRKAAATILNACIEHAEGNSQHAFRAAVVAMVAVLLEITPDKEAANAAAKLAAERIIDSTDRMWGKPLFSEFHEEAAESASAP